MKSMDITVLGAGIAGLACACALAQRGARVRVLERAAALGEIGAGIQISPNGFAVLAALGLGTRLDGVGEASAAVELRVGATGRRLIRLPMVGRGFRLVHRADLIALLAEGAKRAGVQIETGRAVHAVRLGRDGPVLTLADGHEERTGLVVGADGVRSVLRAPLNGITPALFSGQVAWRALIPGTASSEAVIHVGPGRHLVRYPLTRRGMINLVGVEERVGWAAESWTAPDDPANFRRAFAGFCGAVQEDLARVEAVNLWGLFRHEVARRWHGKGAVLIGDAAHPTLPFLAQGANLALEDAWVLADCLARHPVGGALEQYQARRHARVSRAIAAANANARSYHLSHWWQTGPAHTGLRLLDRVAPSLMLRRFDWLYRHDVTTEGG